MTGPPVIPDVHGSDCEEAGICERWNTIKGGNGDPVTVERRVGLAVVGLTVGAASGCLAFIPRQGGRWALGAALAGPRQTATGDEGFDRAFAVPGAGRTRSGRC